MFQIVIRGTYYKENSRFSRFNSRQKKNMVYFYDYDDLVKYIICSLSWSELGRLKINMYNYYHDYIKFTPFGEVDLNGEKFDGYNLESDIIDVSMSDFAKLLPNNGVRNKYFIWNVITEKYDVRSDFINYVKLECPLM